VIHVKQNVAVVFTMSFMNTIALRKT
jgi:hypothetical protein